MATEEFLKRIDREYGNEIKKFISQYVGSDCDYVYNSLLIKIWKGVNDNEIENVPAFLYTVAYHECISFLRKEKKHYDVKLIEIFMK